METGWITTEVGRQPWIVHGVMRTEDAVTDAGYIWLTLTVLVVVYAAMTAGAVAVLRSMSARWRTGDTHLASPYGPSLLDEGLAAGTDGGTDGGVDAGLQPAEAGIERR